MLTMGEMRVWHLTVTGEDRSSELARLLVQHSMWFECTPLPDDEFDFTVKYESGHQLVSLAASVGQPIAKEHRRMVRPVSVG